MVQIGMGFIGNKIQQKEQIHSRPLLIQHHLLQLKLLNGYLLYQVIKTKSKFWCRKIGTLEKPNFSKIHYLRRFDIFENPLFSGNRNFRKAVFAGHRYFQRVHNFGKLISRGLKKYFSLFMGRDTLSWRWILCL